MIAGKLALQNNNNRLMIQQKSSSYSTTLLKNLLELHAQSFGKTVSKFREMNRGQASCCHHVLHLNSSSSLGEKLFHFQILILFYSNNNMKFRGILAFSLRCWRLSRTSKVIKICIWNSGNKTAGQQTGNAKWSG